MAEQTNKTANLILSSFRKLQVNSNIVTMDASQRFRELLNQVENSNLNYVISKTPFSANISVKRSLSKFHHDKSPKKEDLVADVKEETQTKEKHELKSKVVNVLEQNEMLQELLKLKPLNVN